MRKGLLGAYQLGALDAWNQVLKIAEKITGQKGCDVEGLFYTTAFQAGIDKFLLPDISNVEGPRSDFVRARIDFIEGEQSKTHWKIVRQIFSGYLPDDWERDDKFSNVWKWNAFLADLFYAMEEGTNLLALSGIPDSSEIETLLPSELMIPLSNLADSFQNVVVSSAMPMDIIEVSKETLRRYQTVMLSDVFASYVESQEVLEDEEVTVTGAVGRIIGASRELVKTNPQLLAIRRGVVGILSVTPKLIDAAFGRLPGALAEVATRPALNFFENRRRVVVYDFQNLIREIVFTNLVRMHRDSA